MILTTYIAALATVVAVLAGCKPTSTPAPNSSADDKRLATTFRRPALHGLALEEGLNLIDRAPSGASLVARVVGEEITEWQVFDPAGLIATAKKKNDDDDIPNYCYACELTGGTCWEISIRKECCWENWGCQICDGAGQNCKMNCETKPCEDANSQPGKRGDSPNPGEVGNIVPDGSRTLFDARTSRWSVTRPTGERMHVPLVTSINDCAVCTERTYDNVCWALPCLPAKTSTYKSAAP